MEEQTGQRPKALDSKPEVDDYLQSVVSGYYLSVTQMGIHLADLKVFCDMYGIADIERFAILVKTAEWTLMKENK